MLVLVASRPHRASGPAAIAGLCHHQGRASSPTAEFFGSWPLSAVAPLLQWASDTSCHQDRFPWMPQPLQSSCSVWHWHPSGFLFQNLNHLITQNSFLPISAALASLLHSPADLALSSLVKLERLQLCLAHRAVGWSWITWELTNPSPSKNDHKNLYRWQSMSRSWGDPNVSSPPSCPSINFQSSAHDSHSKIKCTCLNLFNSLMSKPVQYERWFKEHLQNLLAFKNKQNDC